MVVWKAIKGYEGRYEVSNHGNVKSLARMTQRYHRGKLVHQPIKERILRLGYTSDGYPTVQLMKDGVPTAAYVHILVATTFIGPRPSVKHQVCHEDGNPRNPHYLNLRYDTPKGNAADRHKHGTGSRGEHNPRAVLTEEFVKQIKLALGQKTIKEVSQELSVNYSTVRCINNGSRWSHVHL